MREESTDILDVLIVGAGISGIGAAFWLQQKCPGKRYTILESRHAIGGTWDLFKYPGIRSDSDMFTFGYRFKPWKNPKSLSDGSSILAYLRETVTENGIDQHIRFHHNVVSANWDSSEALWTLIAETPDGARVFKARFLYMCAGYYHYKEAHRPTFPGEERFKGTMAVPQFWPEDLDYSNKRVVIIGSGATAVTLVPTMAETAAHVTMLQRSPTYIMNLPNRDILYRYFAKLLPDNIAYRLTRWKNLSLQVVTYWLSRVFPRFTKGLIMKSAAKQLPKDYPVEKHFNPSYNPWDQRLCVVPDGDLFTAIREGKASVETDTIREFTEKGILLNSGKELEADIIVIATGLKIRLLGGAKVTVDGHAADTSKTMVYKGMMISDVPNFAIAFGYTNASWTLKADLTSNYVCKLLNYMDRKGYQVVVPRRAADVSEEPFMDFDAGYVKRALDILPKQGSRHPWRVYQNYFMDMFTIRYGKVDDGVLKFRS